MTRSTVVQGVQGVLRIGQTMRILGRTGVGWAVGHHPPAPQLLRETFESLGATYIKLGQFIASSPTFFPTEYVDEFQHCLDQTPAIPYKDIRRILQEELKRPLESVYRSIEPVPLASASIAQVHAATLVNGEEVVIKVQKPGVETVLRTDLNGLYLATRLLETLAPRLSWTSISGVVDEIRSTMMEECDFVQEAQNLETFRRFLKATDNRVATVPEVYHHCSTRRVLTMERFRGVPLTDLETLRRVTPDPEATLIAAMNTWFASLTQCEFFHADVHAGNVLVLEDGRVGFIDFGIVGRIRPETWQAVFQLVSAMSAGEFETMADAMVAIGITSVVVDTHALAGDLRQFYQRLENMNRHNSGAQKADDQVNALLMEMVRVGELHGLHFPREFALLLKQFLYFDRYIHLLAPGMDMFVDERLTLLH